MQSDTTTAPEADSRACSPLLLVDMIGKAEDATITRDEIRRTVIDNAQYVSVYDAIQYLCGQKKNEVGQVFSRMKNRFPDLREVTLDVKFAGQGQRETPVADLTSLVSILMALPGYCENVSRIRRVISRLAVERLLGKGALKSMKSLVPAKKKKNGHIYITRLTQHEMVDDPVWKVGMTTTGWDKSGTLKRIRDYGPDAKQLFYLEVKDARKTEARILDYLRSSIRFASEDKFGCKYFRGDLWELQEIVKICAKCVQ